MLNTTSLCPLPPGSTVWGYLRDSGGDRQERSIDQQREILEAYCERHQLVLDAVYADEARAGAAADDRAGLTALLAAVEESYPLIRDKAKRERAAQKMRHGIVFWSLSRLARDSVLSTLTRADLRARGLTIASLSDEMLTGDENLDPILEALLDWKSDMDLQVIGREALAARPTSPTLLRQLDDAEAEQRLLEGQIEQIEDELERVVEVPLYTDEEIDALIRAQLDRLAKSGEDIDNVKKARRVMAAFIDHITVEPSKPIRATLTFKFTAGQELSQVPPRGNPAIPCLIGEVEVEIPR